MALDGLTNMLMHTATKPPLCEPSAKLSKKNDFSENKRHHNPHFSAIRANPGELPHTEYTQRDTEIFFRVVHFQ